MGSLGIKYKNLIYCFLFTDPRVASSFKLIVSQLKNEYLEFPVVVIGTTHSHNSLATDVQEAFLHEVQIEVCCFIKMYTGCTH